MTEKEKQFESVVSERKKKLSSELVGFMKKNKTFLIASIKNLPSRQFQDIRKKVRSHAVIRVPKKSSITFAVKTYDKNAESLTEKFTEDCAILFSDLDAFELSEILGSSQSSAKARPGQIAPEDIKVEPGPTELIPGPAISELSSVGLKTKIKEGKIEIVDGKTLAKKGEVITDKIAGVMDKLNITPFTVGFEPLVAYDTTEKKIYSNLKIDKKETLNLILEDYKKAMGFAISINYVCPETISYFIGKAELEAKAFEKLQSTEKNSGGKGE